MVKLQIVSVNDVYEIDNIPYFASAKLAAKQDKSVSKVISILPGDFVAPSLLSSLDSGRSMIDVLNIAELDYACIGNHESDIKFRDLHKRMRESNFTWINSNMPDFEMGAGMNPMPEYCIIEVGDKKVALLGLCGEDRSVMKPGAFGGASITPLNESLLSWCGKLSSQVDLIIPMTHQLIGRDRETAKLVQKDLVPIVIGAHDHQPYLEEVEGVKVIKVGQDAQNIGIINIEWEGDDSLTPVVTMEMKKATEFPADQSTAEAVLRHKQVLVELEKSTLFKIPTNLTYGLPFSSQCIRLRPTTVGTFLATICREQLGADLCLLGSGSIRAQRSYDGEENFSYAMLKSEFAFETALARVVLPGAVIADMITFTRSFALQDPPVAKGGYLQTCDRVEWNGNTNTVEQLCGECVEPNRMYTCIMNYGMLQGLDDVQPLLAYQSKFPDDDKNIHPHEDVCVEAKHVIVSYFSSRALFDILHSFNGDMSQIDANNDGVISREEFEAFFSKKGNQKITKIMLDNFFAVCDLDGNGVVTKDEILHLALQNLRFKTHRGRPFDRFTIEEVLLLLQEVVGETVYSDNLSSIIRGLDKNGNGYITREEVGEAAHGIGGSVGNNIRSVFV